MLGCTDLWNGKGKLHQTEEALRQLKTVGEAVQQLQGKLLALPHESFCSSRKSVADVSSRELIVGGKKTDGKTFFLVHGACAWPYLRRGQSSSERFRFWSARIALKS